MKQKNEIFERLKLFYVFVFALTAIIVAPTHIFPPPYFMYARFPHYLQFMGPFFGFSWPVTFEIYHYALYVLGIAASVNALGVLLYPRLKNAATFTSFIGIFLTSFMVIFFFFKFISVNAITAVVLGLYSVVLLILNVSTFRALTVKQKGA